MGPNKTVGSFESVWPNDKVRSLKPVGKIKTVSVFELVGPSEAVVSFELFY